MGLNIKNQRVHDLAREAARVMGTSQTGAIEEALVRLLREHGVEPQDGELARRLAQVREIAVDYAADPGRQDLELARVEDLYDDASGLPR